MRLGFYALDFAVIVWVSTAAHAQRYNPGYAAGFGQPDSVDFQIAVAGSPAYHQHGHADKLDGGA